ncbi:MAG: mechanosensitive ion channel family protein [Kiritimatiellae bacterium]|nr:mechanosensitive ion channel family protein [Kiritimatiellia bacterium]
MSEQTSKLSSALSDYALPFLGVCAWLILGYWFSSLVARLVYTGFSRKLGADKARTVSKGVRFLVIVPFVLTLIHGAGLDITALLGAAGLAGVAIGFASQTGLSNLISGLFLVLERPFKIGDLIEVDGSRGYVHSIEMLSTYIRAYDNRIIRFPNEMLAKSKLINLTRYPIRRIDLDLRVACRENPERVMTVLREVILANPACFNDPEPVIALRGLDETSLDFLVGVWADNQEFFATRTSLLRDIKERFDREGIALPYGRIAVTQCADAVHRGL